MAFWLMARLSRAALRHAGVLVIAACFWNLGVTIGVIGILAGDSTSIEWLEIPPYATPLLFVAYALVGGWAIVTFRFRRAEHIYVSQWYLLAALFWFPWLYSIAQIMLVFEPARGTVQAAMEGLLEPTLKERTLGRAEVRQVFTVSKAGVIAGAYVVDGTITRAAVGVRVIRDNVVVYEGKLGSLRRFKDDVREVQQGYECGISVENFNDIKAGDIIEAYAVDKIAAKL